MRVNRITPARIARALSTVLFISLLQVVVAPVIAPHVTAPIASAADANDLPSGLGTVYQFLAESYTSGSTTWPEARGGTAATISNTATKVSNTAGTLGASKTVIAVQGTVNTVLTFPSTVGPGTSSDYTFLYVARYAPITGSAYQAGNYCDGVTHNAGSDGKARIFTSGTGNWLSGFWACAAGVAFHEGWVTNEQNSVTELSTSSGNNWLLGTDCGYTVASTSACKGRFRAFGTDRTTTPSVSTASHTNVGVHIGTYGGEQSDYQIAEVISYPTILPVSDIIKVETYLARKYGITLSASTATKLGIHRASVGSNLNEAFSVQPQIAIQDANGQTVTTNNSTVITATVTGLNGKTIGTATATAIQGIATFDNLGVDGIPGNTYTITYTSNAGLATTSESRSFTRGGSSETDTALLLNGSNQYADVTDTTGSPYDITGTFTLEAWVNPSNSCSGSGVVVSKRSYMLYCQSYVWRVMILSDGVSGSGVATSVPVEANEWHHIAITKSASSGNVLFYYDGVLVETVNVTTTTMTPNNSPFEIGRYSVLGYYFAGEIDEVRLYNTQRNASQIQGDMSSYGNTTDTTLVAYYDMNDISSSTLFNREYGSTSSTDLTLQNTPTRSDVKTVDTTTLAAYTILKFDRTYITSLGGWKAPSSVTQASVLTVAGGGGGGARHAGGGGAGGVAYAASLPISAGSTYQISIGIGGIGYGQPGNNPFTGTNGASVNINDTGVGTNGGNSVFRVLGSIDSVTAIGGGGSQTAGGSSGGTNSGTTYSTVPAATQYSTSYFVGYGNPGGQGYNGSACGTDWCGGGGGGAGGPGGTPSLQVGNTYPGDGGVGIRLSISGIATYYAGGGGGGSKDTTGASNGGNGGGGAGGSAAQGSHATENTGGGGGGGGFTGTTSYRGGNGGSGIIIVRWITATKPIFTQPTIDTTTAGLTDTITVSANPLNPLTRNYQWQVSTDTGTTWANASSGSGITTSIYTTPILETNTSGSRYQYRVIVTDSDTAGLFIIDTSTAVYIVINARITYTGSYTIQKYGSTHQDTFTVLNGTGNKTFTYSPNNRTGITWSSPIANSAVLTIGTTLFVGTYFETITATDTKGAQTSLGISIVVSKADTITVTAIARTETYTGSTLTFTPAFTVTGLKNSDTVTAASMSWNYNGVENSGTVYSIQSTRPANAGTYTITPVTPSTLTDSYTAVSVVPATLTVNRATRTLSLSNIVSPLKFGSFTTFTSTPSAGVGDGSISYSTPNSESCTISAPSFRAIKSSGTCYATALISQGFNFETATSNTVSTTLAKADTLTVTVDSTTTTTYTGSQYALTPTVTVTGLKNSNTVGATPVTFSYASSGSAGSTCSSGGACAIGDTGPGGGFVFYDAGSQQSWGRYLEIAKSGWSGVSGEATAQWCSAGLTNTLSNVRATGLGYGRTNSNTLATFCGAGAAFNARAYAGGGKTDWFLPTQFEFQYAWDNRNYLDLDPIGIYWLSHEANNADASWVGNSWVMTSQGAGGNSKSDVTAYRPIRAFAAGDASQSFVTTKPTEADTYTVRASALTLSSGSLSDYVAVTYVDGSLRINRAQQSQLFLAEYGAIFGTPYRVIVFGGSGTGTSKVTTTSGTATGCSISGDTLTATSIGTCQVTAVKARDKNYETATVTINVYFLEFVTQQPSPTTSPSPGPGIALTGLTSVTLDPYQAPTITGLSATTISLSAGGSLTITGAGFTTSPITVKFWRNKEVSVTSTNGTTLVIPFSAIAAAGATTGRVLVTTPNGQAVSVDTLTINP